MFIINFSEETEFFEFISQKNVELLICNLNELILENYDYFQTIKYFEYNNKELMISKNEIQDKLKLFLYNTRNLKYFHVRDQEEELKLF